MSDLVRTVAAVFARKGVNEMKVKDFKHALSMDLRWFRPAEARNVLMHAADVGLVTVEADAVRPAFDVKAVRVPVSFRPTLTVLEERPGVPAAATASEEPDARAAEDEAPPSAPAAAEAGALVERLVKDAAAAVMGDPADVRRAIEEEKARREGVLDEDVAALVVARRFGVDVAARAEKLLAQRARERPHTQT